MKKYYVRIRVMEYKNDNRIVKVDKMIRDLRSIEETEKIKRNMTAKVLTITDLKNYNVVIDTYEASDLEKYLQNVINHTDVTFTNKNGMVVLQFDVWEL